MPEDIGHIVDRAVKHADGTDAARVWASIIPTATGVPIGRPISSAAVAQRPSPQGVPRIDNPLADADKIFIRQLFEANLAEVTGIPALFMRR
ncbi:hypothetical protein LNQ03_02235 [Klebsiella pneumoniae subsp. pneumoniae]|nr:hypothetical protein [Klebsiella pneumoniae subsp. pneumoniae]